jgi:N12 class adenine-specific DNA methylase
MVDVHDQLNATQRARITGLCAIRDHARALLDAQLADEGDGRLGHLRAMLNGTYDRFVARYGCLSHGPTRWRSGATRTIRCCCRWSITTKSRTRPARRRCSPGAR